MRPSNCCRPDRRTKRSTALYIPLHAVDETKRCGIAPTTTRIRLFENSYVYSTDMNEFATAALLNSSVLSTAATVRAERALHFFIILQYSILLTSLLFFALYSRNRVEIHNINLQVNFNSKLVLLQVQSLHGTNRSCIQSTFMVRSLCILTVVHLFEDNHLPSKVWLQHIKLRMFLYVITAHSCIVILE